MAKNQQPNATTDIEQLKTLKAIRSSCKYISVIATLILAFGICDHLHLLGGKPQHQQQQPTPAMQGQPAQHNRGPISDNINDYHPRKHAQQPQQGQPQQGQPPQGQKPQHPQHNMEQQQRPQAKGQWQPEQVKATPPEELMNEFEHPAIKEDRTHERPEQRDV